MVSSAVALLLLLTSWVGGGESHGLQQQIPKLLHRSFLKGVAALHDATAGPQPKFKAHWLGSCMTQNPGWHEVVWDEASVLKLIQQDFPWFLPTYLSYPRLVQRSDVMRYLVLYKYGGVYLDADVECYTSIEQSLQGRDLVLSCEEIGLWGQLHNAAMASSAGHPFWISVLQEAMRRAPAAEVENGSWSSRQLKKLWRSSPFHDPIIDVLHSTGPQLLTDVYQAHTGGAPACGTSITVGASVSTAYPVGSWFTPCLCGDEECEWYWAVQHFKLMQLQQEGQKVQVPAFKWLRSKSKNERRKQRAQQQRWLRQQHERPSSAAGVVQLRADQLHVVGIHHYSASWTGWDQSHRLRRLQQFKDEMSGHVLDFFRSGSFLQQGPDSPSSCTAQTGTAQTQDLIPVEQHLKSFLLDTNTTSSGSSAPVHSLLVQVVGTPSAAPAPAPAALPSCSLSLDSRQRNSSERVNSTYQVASEPCQVDESSSSRIQLGASRPSRDTASSAATAVAAAFVEPQAADLQLELQQTLQQTLQQAGWKISLITEFTPMPAALQQLLSRPEHAANDRYAVHFSCNGCEKRVLQEMALSWAQDWLADTQVLLVDLHLSKAYGSSSSSNDLSWGLDDLFNLLHQQLGFKGALQHMLNDDLIQLGWVRGTSQNSARLQSPDAESSAAVLQAASVDTPQVMHRHAACDCCSLCLLWQRAACSLLGRLSRPTACHVLLTSPAVVSSSMTAAAGDSSGDGSSSIIHKQHEEGSHSTIVLPVLGLLDSWWYSAVPQEAFTASSGPAAICMASHSPWGHFMTCVALTAAAIACFMVLHRLCKSVRWEVWASKCVKLTAAQSL